MAAGPRAAARLAVDRAHRREDGGRRLTGRDLTQSSGPGTEVASTWKPRRMGRQRRPGRLIRRLTACGGIRRTAASRKGRLALAAGGGEGELIPRLGSGRGRAMTAGGGGQSRRHADVAAREESEGCAGSGLAEPVKCCDAHAVTRDPMVTGGARTAALCGGGSGDTARRQRRRPTALGQPGGGQGDPRERGGERNRRERSRRWRIAAAAITGEQKGKTRRDDEGSIQRDGSISGVQGIRSRRRIGRSGTEVGWQRETASGTEHGGRRASARCKGDERRFGGETWGSVHACSGG
uniref:Circumsporozoite protein-like n=1 Tax=Oryza sativa subsp. japonica TaxID=39947 RepID=Q6K1Z5_ORYSJ|nr:circumsporozoite protein-like [Oryza sativa Japonica Group]